MGGRYRLVFWGAIAVAGLATFGAYKVLAANRASSRYVTQPVVVATRPIPEGTVVDRVAVNVEAWPVASIPQGAYSVPDSVIGRVARLDMFAGEALIAGRLAPTGSGPGLEIKIPPGQRAMAVRIDDVAGISGLLQPNSRVDVLVTARPIGTEEQVARMFMENMRVLSVGTAVQRDANGRPIQATTVTLGVTPEEAERLAIAMNHGTIQLVLRGYGDPDAVITRGATSRQVIAELRGGRAAEVKPPTVPARPVQRRPQVVPVVIAPPPPPPPRPDSALVNVYRAGKATPLKFDTVQKR